ncbi:esterase/lipase family protein [Vibrio sp. WXL103]|uniref:esterase/lipase family protein n=1 Tax=Vibrio sp. WXL103 TaxID=3450710 RepID=UPI003EC8404A
MFAKAGWVGRLIVALCWVLLASNSAVAKQGLVDVETLFPDKQVKRCDNTSQPLLLRQDEPLVLVVHGCRSSAGQFKALAQVYEHLGEQTACFEYDDRRSLEKVSGELIDAMNTLSPIVGDERMVVLGHSQGGLITRRAHADNRQDSKTLTHDNIDIATISAPFNGIEASSHCGIGWLRIATLGIVDAICYVVAGPKYLEIPPQSSFIEQPGPLANQVRSHLVIKTDETDTCRSYSSTGQCDKDDYVFSLAEQTQHKIENSLLSETVVIDAGHVEIVGGETTTPWKLISLLQQHDLMTLPADKDKVEFIQVVNRIFQFNIY